MPRLFYPKLAVSSIKRHSQVYGPYLAACTLMVTMFYLIMFLAAHSGLHSMQGSESLRQLLGFGAVVVGLFAVIFLFYTNSFLIRRRKRELGLYNILGMEKRHIARILSFETLFAAVFSMAAGLAAGVLLSKLILLVLLNLVAFPIPFGFEVPRLAVLTTLQLFSALFMVILASSLYQVRLAQPIDLLKAEAAGEWEPKARWLLALLGVFSLGAGYFLALAIEHPLDALVFFFVAVVLVMIGTYLLFTTGSIALLKLLRKNKRLYYRPRPFIAISGMLYRMKQNGVGLANICILSTMLLVTLSTTVSLFVGIEDVLRTRYPREIVIELDSYAAEAVEGIRRTTAGVLSRHGLAEQNLVEYRFLTFPVFKNGSKLLVEREAEAGLTGAYYNLYITPLEDYNRLVQEPVTLGEDEVLLYSNRGSYEYDTVEILDRQFAVKEKLDSLPGSGLSRTQTFGSYYLVVPDMAVMESLRQHPAWSRGGPARTLYLTGFDLDTSSEQAVALFSELRAALPKEIGWVWAESRDEARAEFYVLYGGLFFLGIFLGTLFLLGTVLIIYYKQVTEGYEDRRRYVIMQQVGMSKQEVKRAIQGQVLSVFFLPLAAAGVHVVFSFRMITRLLILFNLTNTSLFVACTAATFAAFGLFYALVYRLTTRVYYRLAAA